MQQAPSLSSGPAFTGVIVRLCGLLPLAVRTVGARLATRRHRPLATMAARLTDERRRLDELTAGDVEVRASVSLSYRLLDEQGRTAFGRLGLLRVPDFAPWIIAPLLDVPVKDAEAPCLIVAVSRAAALNLDVAACDLAAALSFSHGFNANRLSEWHSHEAALAAARRAVRAGWRPPGPHRAGHGSGPHPVAGAGPN